MADPIPPPPPTVTVTTTGTGGGDTTPLHDTFFWGRSIDTTAKALIALVLACGAVLGLLKEFISGEGYIGLAMAAFAWYSLTRPAQSAPGSTEVKTTTSQSNHVPTPPAGSPTG